MKIGDKVTFNRYLPINEIGKNKIIFENYSMPVVLNPLEEATEETEATTEIVSAKRRIRILRKTKDTEHNTVKYEINRVPIKPTSGIYVGSIKKKLCREYRIETEPPRPTSITNGMSDMEMISRAIGRSRSMRNYSPLRISTNPYRLDNPYKLEEVAIIAVSKRKRYMVAMSDILTGRIKIV